MNIINSKIIKIYQGSWEASEGVDMPGIAGPTWYYTNLFLKLDNGQIICVSVSVGEDLGVVDYLPKDASPTNDEGLKNVEGKRSVVNIYYSNIDLIAYVLLDDGSHIDYSYQPGGSNWCIDKFEDWDQEDLGDDDTDETYTSLIDGTSLTWMQLVKWYKNV